MKEVPDSYIQRNDYENEPGPPNRDDACMVCDRIDCVCPPEDPPQETEQEHKERMIAFAEYKATKRKCDDCGKPSDTDLCQDCCPHDEHDHGICLECAKDIMDDLIDRAEMLRDE